jgi:predicted DNA repair protein MutK
MKNTVLRYGIGSAFSIIVLFLISSLLLKDLDFNTQEIYGYVSIIVSLSFVFFGIKHFRDTKNHGLLSFGKGLLIGLLITLFASITFGVYNVVYVEYIDPNFMTEYYNHSVEHVSKTLSGAELQAKLKQMEDEKDMFSNPFMNFSLMFFTVFMIGLIISLISSLILQNKKQ